MYVVGGRALDRLGGFTVLPNLTKLRIPTINYTAGTLRVLSPVSYTHLDVYKRQVHPLTNIRVEEIRERRGCKIERLQRFI